jgi:hypothetical protein
LEPVNALRWRCDERAEERAALTEPASPLPAAQDMKRGHSTKEIWLRAKGEQPPSESRPTRAVHRAFLYRAHRARAWHELRRTHRHSIAKLFATYLRRAEESVLGSVSVELTILLTSAHQHTTQVLNEAAALYKVDTDAIAAKIK